MTDTTDKTISAFNAFDNAKNHHPNNDSMPPQKKKRVWIIVIVGILAVSAITIVCLILFFEKKVVSDKELQEAKNGFLPPGMVVSIDGNKDDPSNNDIQFSFDSRSRIMTCNYKANGKEYKQEYKYSDAEKRITIITTYKTVKILEIEIEYARVREPGKLENIDGYYVRLDKESLSDIIDIGKPHNDSTNDGRIDLPYTPSKGMQMKDYLGKSKTEMINEFGDKYTQLDIPGSGSTECLRFDRFYHAIFGFSENTDRVIIIYDNDPDIPITDGIYCDMTLERLKKLDNSDFTAEEYELEIDRSYHYVLKYNTGLIVDFVWELNHNRKVAANTVAINDTELSKTEAAFAANPQTEENDSEEDNNSDAISEDEAVALCKERMVDGYFCAGEGTTMINNVEYYVVNIRWIPQEGEAASHLGYVLVTLDGKSLYWGDKYNGNYVIDQEI